MRYKVTNPLLCTMAEAEDILNKLKDIVYTYGCATVADMYDMVCMLRDLRGDNDYAYGWISLEGAIIQWNDSEGAYEICLPPAIPLVTTSCITADICQPKMVADIIVCGSLHLHIDETMDFVKPTPEQIKNLHDMLCIDVKLYEETP